MSCLSLKQEENVNNLFSFKKYCFNTDTHAKWGTSCVDIFLWVMTVSRPRSIGEGRFCWTGIKFVHSDLSYVWQLGLPQCSSQQAAPWCFPLVQGQPSVWAPSVCPATVNASNVCRAACFSVRRTISRSIRTGNQCCSGSDSQRLWSCQSSVTVGEQRRGTQWVCVWFV